MTPVDSEEEIPLQQQSSGLLAALLVSGSEFVAAYGWFIFFGVIFAFILYSYVKPSLFSWMNQRQQNNEAAMYAKDPEKFIQRQEAMEAARRVMQERHDALAEQYRVKMKEMEEKKRLEKIKNWEQLQEGKGSKCHPAVDPEPSSSTGVKSSKKPDRTERLRGNAYNPLTGSGSGACFRPTRRGMSGGG